MSIPFTIPVSIRFILSTALAALLLAFAADSASARPLHHFRKVDSCHRRAAHARACLAVRVIPVGTNAVAASVSSQTAPPPEEALTPQQLHSAYLLPWHGGGNQTTAIVDAFDDPAAEADLAVYDREFHLPACTTANGCFRKVNEHGQSAPLPKTEPGWDGEISMDLQLTHAICPECHILLVESENENSDTLDAAVNTAAALGATEISNSYGEEEEPAVESEASYYDHPGVAITAASGDEGEETGFPASAPSVIAVGGTTLEEEGGKWEGTTWEGTGSGCSKLFPAQPWQLALADYAALGCEGKRANNDVAAVADPETGVAVYDSVASPESPAGWGQWGGTSASSPIVAAEFALSGGTHGVAYPAETLYKHLGQSSALIDVTEGENAEKCTSPICEAGVGYDGPTGVGSPLGLEAFSVAGAPTHHTTPVISGLAKIGRELRATPGAWTGGASLSYEWQRSDGEGFASIPGATGLSYHTTRADAGYELRFVVFARNASGVSDTVSPPVAVLPKATHITALTLSPNRFSAAGGGSLVSYKASTKGKVTLSLMKVNIADLSNITVSSLGKFSHHDVHGTNRVYLNSVWHGHPLSPGTYFLVLTPKLGLATKVQFTVT